MNKREELRKFGLYIIIVLALANFLVKPLQTRLREAESMLNQLKQTYFMKRELYERKLSQIKPKEGEEKKLETKDLSMLYPQDWSYNAIRSKLLKWLTAKAEEKNLAVINFELLEVKKGPEVSEIPIVLRLRGDVKPFLEFLKTVETAEKLIIVRNLEVAPSRPDFTINLTLSVFRREM
jgi:Tfp pilus assembly protein PilO